MKLIIQQPALPKFRVPFFRDLASRSGINLTLYYSMNDPGLPNVEPEGFLASYVPMKKFSFFKKHPILWHSPQWKYASRKYCDVLSLSWDLHYLSLVPSIIKARINRVPVVLWGHGYSKQENVIRKFLRKAVARLATALVFYDFKTANNYIKAGWPSKKIYVAPNSLDQSKINNSRNKWLANPIRLEQFQYQHDLGLGPNLIYIGRVYPDNRLDVLIQALPKIIDQFPSAQLIVIGKGDAEVKNLKSLSKELHIEDKIIWTGPLYEEDEIAPWMLLSSVFCYPSNIGLSLMHAFGYGLPVITGDCISEHNPEIYALEHGINGMLFSKNSSDALADTVCSLLRQPQKLALMGANARRTVLETYNISRMADGFESAVCYSNCFYKR